MTREQWLADTSSSIRPKPGLCSEVLLVQLQVTAHSAQLLCQAHNADPHTHKPRPAQLTTPCPRTKPNHNQEAEERGLCTPLPHVMAQMSQAAQHQNQRHPVAIFSSPSCCHRLLMVQHDHPCPKTTKSKRWTLSHTNLLTGYLQTGMNSSYVLGCGRWMSTIHHVRLSILSFPMNHCNSQP